MRRIKMSFGILTYYTIVCWVRIYHWSEYTCSGHSILYESTWIAQKGSPALELFLSKIK